MPRRDDYNPKTIKEIHKEAQQENQQKAMMAQQYDSQLKQRGGPPRRMPQGFGTPNQTEADEWQIVGKNNRNLNSMHPEKRKFTWVRFSPDTYVLGLLYRPHAIWWPDCFFEKAV